MSSDDIPLCKYGEKCYRKSEDHRKKFRHVSVTDDEQTTDIAVSDEDKPLPKKRKSSLIETTSSKKRLIDDYFSQNHSDNMVKEDTSNVKQKDTEVSLLPQSPTNIKDNLKEKFLVNMSKDFFDFFEFCTSLDSKNPKKALYSELKLELCGPYDVLSGEYKTFSTPAVDSWLTHCRYFHDPPEMLTVVRGDSTSQYHLGYFRDDPNSDPVFVVSAETSNSGKLTKLGPNLFAAINTLIESQKKKSSSLTTLQNKLQKFANEHDYTLKKVTKEMQKRDSKSVCKTLHGAGMVVPVDENDVGYREVPLTHKELSSLLEKIVSAKNDDERNERYAPLDEIITYIQFANDEGDFGEGLELGLSMLAFHPKNSIEDASIFNGQIKSLMSLAYQLLNRPAFEEIINAHMDNRRSKL